MKYLLPLAALLALSGCDVSLQPFYSKDTVVDDRSVEGRWTDGDDTWQVTRTAPGRFDIAECKDGDCKVDTVGVLFRAAGVTFLDVTEKASTTFSTTFRLHGVFQFRMQGEDADLIVLDADKVSKLAARKALDTEFADTDSGPVLTGRPEVLQRFLVRHLTDGQIFGETHHLRRPFPGE